MFCNFIWGNSLWYISALDYKHVSGTNYARNTRFYCTCQLPVLPVSRRHCFVCWYFFGSISMASYVPSSSTSQIIGRNTRRSCSTYRMVPCSVDKKENNYMTWKKQFNKKNFLLITILWFRDVLFNVNFPNLYTVDGITYSLI